MGVPHPNGGNGKWQFGVRLCVLMKGNKGRKIWPLISAGLPRYKGREQGADRTGREACSHPSTVGQGSQLPKTLAATLAAFFPPIGLSIHPPSYPTLSFQDKEDSFPVPKGLSGSNKAKASGCCQPLSQMTSNPLPWLLWDRGVGSPTKKKGN